MWYHFLDFVKILAAPFVKLPPKFPLVNYYDISWKLAQHQTYLNYLDILTIKVNKLQKH